MLNATPYVIGKLTYNSTATAGTLTFTGLAIPANTLVVLGWTANVASLTVTSVADNSAQSGTANSWNKRTPVAASGMTFGTAWVITTRALLSTDTVTVTLSGATSTRRSGTLTAISGASGSLDKTTSIASKTTSPFAIGATATLSGTNELAIAYSGWIGGAVASGWADATIGFENEAAVSSGGTTPRVETNGGIKYTQAVGTGAVTDTHTFTSVTAGAGEILTFKAPLRAVSNSAPDVQRISNPTALDTFNAGATQALTARTGWSTTAHVQSGDISFSTDSVPTYATKVSTGYASNVWNTSFSSNDQEVWFTHGSFIDSVDLFLRLNTANLPSSGYGLRVSFSGNWQIMSSAFATLKTVQGPTPAAGDTILLTAQAQTITAWYIPAAGGAAQPILEYRDTSLISGSFIAVGSATGDTPRLDAFGGGNIVFANSPIVNSSGIANLSVNVPAISLTAISKGVSAGSAAIVRRSRNTGAVSTGYSTGICALTVNLPNIKTLTAVSIGNSYPSTVHYLNRAYYFGGAVTGIASSGICNLSVAINENLTAVSTGSSTGTAKCVRTRTFQAQSSGSSTGVCVLAVTGQKLLTCVSTDTSTGTAKITRKHNLTAISTGSSTGIVPLNVSALSFPTTGILDNFDVGTPTVLTNRTAIGWSSSQLFTGQDSIVIDGTAASGNSVVDISSNAWNTPFTDSEVYVSLPGGVNNQILLFVRATPGTVPIGYAVYSDGTNFDIIYYDGTTNHVLASYTQTIAANDGIGLSVVGNELTAWHRSGISGTWVAAGSPITDNNISGPGLIGIVSTDTVTLFDNFGGGTPIVNETQFIVAVSGGSSSGICAKLTRAHNLTCVSTESSTGICVAIRTRKLAAVSTGSSTGLTNVIRNRSVTYISLTTSSGTTSLTRKRSLSAISTGASTGVCTIQRTKGLACVSTGSSTGLTSISRKRSFAAISTGASTGVCTVGRSHQFSCISTGNSIGVATLVRKRSFAATSTGASTGVCAVGRAHAITCQSTGNSTGTAGFVRHRTFSAVSTGASTGICLFTHSGAMTCVSTGSSTGVSGLVRNRHLIGLSTGSSTGICTFARVIDLTCVSTGASNGTASCKIVQQLVSLNGGSSSGISTLVRNRKIVGISSGLSSGTCTLSTLVTIFAGSGGSSAGLVSVSRKRNTACTSGGSSTGITSLIRTRDITYVSTESSTGQLTVIRNRHLTAVSNGTSAGICGLTKLGSNAYVSTGTSSGVARFAIAHSLTAVSNGNSGAQTICSRKRGFAGLSNGSSSGIVTLGRTQTFAAVSSGSSNGICAVGRKRTFACSSVSISTGVISINRIRTFAAISSGNSAGTCTTGRVHNAICISRGSSSGVTQVTRTRALAAISSDTSAGICALGTIGFHAFISTGSSSGIASLHRSRSLTAISSGSSSATCNGRIARGLICQSFGSSSGTTALVRNRALISRSTGFSSAYWSTSGVHILIATSSGTSAAHASIFRARTTDAISTGNSSALCKVFRNRNFAASSTDSSTGTAKFKFNRRLFVFSNDTSSGHTEIFRNRSLHANSTDTSAGYVKIGDVNQYGTVYIWDQNTYNVNITDSLVCKLEDEESSDLVSIYDK